MEMHVVEEVMERMDDDPNCLSPYDLENFLAFEEWFRKTESGTSSPSNLISREFDPLLSEAQIVDGDPLLESYNIRIPNGHCVPEKLKAVDALTAVLRSVNNTTDQNINSSNSNSDIGKHELLMDTSPETVEITVSDKTAYLVFKNNLGAPIFLTQHMQLPENYIRPERMQNILHTNLVEVCKELNITMPQITTTLGAKFYLCPLRCTNAFLHFADAKLHTLKHMQIKPYKCDKADCPWEFYTACKLARHKETHSKNRHFICDILNCKKTFSTVYNLNEHKKKHNKPATLPCTVSGCEMLFQNDKQRRAHFKTHNHAEAPFHCQNGRCTKAFFAKGLLECHIRSCTQKESEVTCNYPECGKMFSTPYRLREHIRQHTGAKPYQCQFQNCTWRFVTASKLKRHQSTHTPDRKFHCTMGSCNKSFLRSEHLREHTLTHIEKRGVETEGKAAFLSQIKKYGEKKPECTKVHPDEEESMTGKSSADVLLEEAIKSLDEAPSDIILGAEIINDEPAVLLENEKFSTVNLRDLD